MNSDALLYSDVGKWIRMNPRDSYESPREFDVCASALSDVVRVQLLARNPKECRRLLVVSVKSCHHEGRVAR